MRSILSIIPTNSTNSVKQRVRGVLSVVLSPLSVVPKAWSIGHREIQPAASRGQQAEERGQKTEDRGQTTAGMEHETKPLEVGGALRFRLEAVGRKELGTKH